MNKQQIVCFHLYNDFSGSPTILRTILKGLLRKGVTIDLVTSNGGILDTLKDGTQLRKHHYFYRFSKNPAVTILRFLWVQIYIFLFSFRYMLRPHTVFYINTILPVGAALAGRIMGKRVVYHCHENAWMKGRIYKELSRAMSVLASDIICVSDYQRNTLHSHRNVKVVPNSVSAAFITKLHPDAARGFERRNIIMACSPRMYKGINEFMAVASRLPQYQFTLVLNIAEDKKDGFISRHDIHPSANVTILSCRDNMYDLYNDASIVLNLSNKDEFIETFGMTIIEGLAAGLPCIVPETGGIRELVNEGVTGYHNDSKDTDGIAQHIDYMLTNRDVYISMSQAALDSSRIYTEQRTIDGIHNVLFPSTSS